MKNVVLLSGWAGVAELFPELSRRCRFLVPFVDGDEAAMLEAVEASGADVLCGWSTGAHMILARAARLLPRFSRVVLAAPFLRFADSLPARVTRAMRQGMDADPEATVRAFWRNCGVAVQPAWRPEWTAPLAGGLDYLLASEAPATPVPAGHVLVLRGASDRIVRAPAVDAALAMLPGARLVTLPGGHCLDEAVLASYCF